MEKSVSYSQKIVERLQKNRTLTRRRNAFHGFRDASLRWHGINLRQDVKSFRKGAAGLTLTGHYLVIVGAPPKAQIQALVVVHCSKSERSLFCQ